MRISSFHLPSVGVDSAESFEAAVRAARFAEGLGAEVALFNADTRPVMIAALPRYLDAVADVPVTIAVQNHPGAPWRRARTTARCSPASAAIRA